MVIDFEALAAAFPADDVRWKPQATSPNTGKALAVAYITARAVQDRLDMVCGPENWQTSYDAGPAGGVLCRLSIRCDDEWITKVDGAENTQVSPVKGGISDALRRAAVAWGIGRYLYRLPQQWADAEFSDNKQFRRFKRTPSLPAWALPSGHPVPIHQASPEAREERIDRETGEIQAAPAPSPTGRAPAGYERTTTSGQAPWKQLTDYMTAMHVTSSAVKEVIGGFSETFLATYMEQHGLTDPIVIVDGIVAQRAAVTGGGR